MHLKDLRHASLYIKYISIEVSKNKFVTQNIKIFWI